MENLLNEIIETITVILGWFKTIWSQFSEFIINANDKVDLAKESFYQMLNASWFITLLAFPITVILVKKFFKIIFKK